MINRMSDHMKGNGYTDTPNQDATDYGNALKGFIVVGLGCGTCLAIIAGMAGVGVRVFTWIAGW